MTGSRKVQARVASRHLIYTRFILPSGRTTRIRVPLSHPVEHGWREEWSKGRYKYMFPRRKGKSKLEKQPSLLFSIVMLDG